MGWCKIEVRLDQRSRVSAYVCVTAFFLGGAFPFQICYCTFTIIPPLPPARLLAPLKIVFRARDQARVVVLDGPHHVLCIVCVCVRWKEMGLVPAVGRLRFQRAHPSHARPIKPHTTHYVYAHHAPRRDVHAHDAHPHAAAAPDLHLHVRRPPHALLRVEAVVLRHLLLCVLG